MTDQHPIVPSFELRSQWHSERPFKVTSVDCEDYMIDRAAQWGADKELEACCEWFQEFYKTESWVRHDLKHLRTARRPKPPSLREQALAELEEITTELHGETGSAFTASAIRRALEALPND